MPVVRQPSTLEQRISVERRIIRNVVDALVGAGFAVSVSDGKGGYRIEKCVRPLGVLKRLAPRGDDMLLVNLRSDAPGVRPFGWIQFHHGDGAKVVKDYSFNVEPFVKPALSLAHSLRGMQCA